MSEIVIRISVPEGTTFRVEQAQDDFENEPLPPEPNQPTAFRGMANGSTVGVCPVHHVPWKVVPAGVSKKTGRPYNSFSACPEMGCEERPR